MATCYVSDKHVSTYVSMVCTETRKQSRNYSKIVRAVTTMRGFQLAVSLRKRKYIRWEASVVWFPLLLIVRKRSQLRIYSDNASW